MTASQVRREVVHEPPRSFEVPLKELGNSDVDSLVWMSDANHYYRGSKNLHVHCTTRYSDLCILLQHPPLSQPRVTSMGRPVWHLPGREGVGEPSGENWKFRVSVGIGELVDDTQAVDDFTILGSVIVGLNRLEDCDRAVSHVPSAGGPTLPLLESVLVLPWLGRFPHAAEEDGKGDAVAVLCWDHRGRKVLQPGTKVVNEVRQQSKPHRCRVAQ